MNIYVKSFILLAGLFFYPVVAFAYIGPGLGLGVFASVLGVLVGLLMLIIGIIWYPIKRLIHRFKAKK
jgi:hypothetical protein